MKASAALLRIRRPIDIVRARKVPGWMTPLELGWLAQRARDARVIVEIGSWKGRSTRALADNTRGTVYAIDPFEGPCYTDAGETYPLKTDVWKSFAWQLKDHLKSGRVRVIKATSAVALPAWLKTHGATADLVFVDGDHRQAAVAADLEAAWPLLKAGGLLAGHDFTNATWPGVQAAVVARFNGSVQTFETIWWVRKA